MAGGSAVVDEADYDADFISDFSEEEVEDDTVNENASSNNNTTRRHNPGSLTDTLDNVDDNSLTTDVDWLKRSSSQTDTHTTDTSGRPNTTTIRPAALTTGAATVTSPGFGDATAAHTRPRPPKGPPSADRARIQRAGTVRIDKPTKKTTATAAVAPPVSTHTSTIDSGRLPFAPADTPKPKTHRSKEEQERGDAVVTSFAAKHPYKKPVARTADARVKSATSRKVAALRNKVTERDIALNDALQEIKTLKSQLRRQDKALDKLQSSEADMPTTLARKDDEIRALEELNRRERHKVTDLTNELKEKEKQIVTLSDQNRSLESMVATKGLKSRKALTKKVEELTATLEERQADVARLEKIVEQQQRQRHRKKLKEEKDAVHIEEMVALRKEVDTLRDLLEREKRMRSVRRSVARVTPIASPEHAPKPTTMLLTADGAPTTPAARSPSPRPPPSMSPTAKPSLPPPMASPVTREPSPAKSRHSPIGPSPALTVTLDDPKEDAHRSAEIADAERALAELANEERARADRVAAEQRAAQQLAEAQEAQRQAELAVAARAAEVQRQQEEQQRKQAEMEAAAAAQRERDAKAAEAERQRKAELLKKLAVLDAEKDTTFAAAPIPDTTTLSTKLSQHAATIDAPTTTASPSGAAPTGKTQIQEEEDDTPGWLRRSATSQSPSERKEALMDEVPPSLRTSLDAAPNVTKPNNNPTTGSASSRRSRRQMPTATRESDNLFRGLPSQGPLGNVIKSEVSADARTGSGHSQRSLTNKLGAEGKAVIPGISSTSQPSVAAPYPSVDPPSQHTGNALPSIGGGGGSTAGSASGRASNGALPVPPRPSLRNRGRLGGPARGGNAGNTRGFHGPKRKKPQVPWEGSGSEARPSMGSVQPAVPDVDDMETIAI
eukprot:m.195446 g.195446  ORF g.195446 m.195446 type:complete len:897 (-) comp19479_c0_seq1:86-2776(-)